MIPCSYIIFLLLWVSGEQQLLTIPENVRLSLIVSKKWEILLTCRQYFHETFWGEPTVVYEERGEWTHHGLASDAFSVDKLFSRSLTEEFARNYWLGPDGETGKFILDYGNERLFKRIRWNKYSSHENLKKLWVWNFLDWLIHIMHTTEIDQQESLVCLFHWVQVVHGQRSFRKY